MAMFVRVGGLSLLLALALVCAAQASVYDGLTVEQVRAHPQFVADTQSMSGTCNSGEIGADHVYWWIGYIPDGDRRVYFTSFGEPLTCVKWAATGEWVPEWALGSLQKLLDGKYIEIQTGWQEPKDFSFTTFDGKEHTLASLLKGKPLVINFWADWCPPCVAELPHFDAAYKAHQGEFDLYALAVRNAKDPVGFLKEKGYSFPAGHDINGAYTYGVTGIPTTLFISSTGRIVNIQIGGMDEATFEAKLALILN
jgi:thiol-disulfide isomerase/thioredoxin